MPPESSKFNHQKKTQKMMENRSGGRLSGASVIKWGTFLTRKKSIQSGFDSPFCFEAEDDSIQEQEKMLSQR